MDKGETITVELNLQNMKASSDALAVLELLSGEEIASLPNKEFLVKANTSDTMVPLIISVPEDAEGPYSVKVRVRPNPPESLGGVSMGTGMVVGFDVLIKEQKEEIPEKRNPYLLTAVIFLVLAILVVLFFLSKKKKRKTKHSPVAKKKKSKKKR